MVFESRHFFDNKEQLVSEVKKYYYFAMGRYLTLASFRLIIEKCKYDKEIIEETSLFADKEFIKRHIVSRWLKTILDKLIEKYYLNFEKNVGSGMKTFYTRDSTWHDVGEGFKNMELGEDKEHKDIFPLDFRQNSS